MRMIVLLTVAVVISCDISEAEHVKQSSIDVISTALVTTSTDLIPGNIWYVSDYGSDDNNCHSESASCRNLQTLLDRATDGADIYVTSNSLSLDARQETADDDPDPNPACLIDSPLSYTISHLDNKVFSVTCGIGRTNWRVSENELVQVRGATTVTINHGNFTGNIRFSLQGLININYCSFNSEYVYIDIYRSEYEPTLTEENVRSLESIMADRSIKMYKSNLTVSKHFWIALFQTSQKLIFSHCNLNCEYVRIQNREWQSWNLRNNTLANNESDFFFTSLQIDHSSVLNSNFLMYSEERFLTHIKVISVTMFNVRLKSNDDCQNSNFIVNVENSTWVNNDNAFMDLYKVISINITSSVITGTCDACTLVNVSGQRFSVASYIRKYLDSIKDVSSSINTLSLTKTVIIAPGSLQAKIRTQNAATVVKNSTFIIEDSVSFSVRHSFEAQYIMIQCSTGKMANRTIGQEDVIYTCFPVCERELKYSLQAGRLIVNEKMTKDHVTQKIKQQSHPELNSIVPSCHPCPLGAKCENDIQVLPNYWGYVTSSESVSMIRCPDGYCCQGNETCKGIDACNIGRTGNLCGTCEQNLTESIFIPKCVPHESCKTGLVITFFIVAGLVYAAILLSLSTVKKKLIFLLKKVKAKCTNKQTSSEGTKTDENGFKYLQILFYYVQDSKLFTVYLPKIDVQTEGVIVNFLEFSPKILGVYVQATELCFAFSSPIVKVVFQLLFGFLVMFFMFVTYIIQIFLSHFLNCQVLLKDLKVKLVQAYLLTILFSYQKMVMGAFILVQCVAIQDSTVLFIQANVECYTWWQICILVYICTSVVPIFFVLAHLPFYVKDKKMSVKAFVLACLFPLPAVIGYHILRIWNKRHNATGFLDRGRNETIQLSDIPLQGIVKKTNEKEISFEESPLVRHKGAPDVKEAVSGDITQSRGANVGNIVEFQGSGIQSTDKIDVSDKETNFAETRTKDIGFCAEVIVQCLLKHYKCLSFSGIRFTWLGVHKIYRVALVACRTFITEQVKRLYIMSSLVLFMAATTSIVKPYKDSKANATARISYIANLCIAALNLVKAHLVTFGCDTNCQYRDKVVQNMGILEDTLLLYIPLICIGVWVVYTGIEKGLKKCK